MSLPPADVIAAATGGDDPELALAPVTAALIPLADGIRNTLASIALIPLDTASPAERAEIVRLRDEVERIRKDASTWVDAIDLMWRRAAAALGAKELPMDGGVVKVEPPRAEWKVDVAGLREELLELAGHGHLSLEEVDSIFTTTVETKADGNRLRYFANNRGEELAAAVARHRTQIPGNPLSAKVTFVRRSE